MTRRSKVSPPRSPRLFAEPEGPAPPSGSVCVAHVDGASRGNPGPAAYAAVIRAADGKPLAELSKYIGRATNNVAEYYALIAALDYAAGHSIARLQVRSDSELLVCQMQGLYKVKSADLRPLHERARKLAGGLEYFSIEHVPREQNRRADALANAALDRTGPGDELSAAGREIRNSKWESRRVRARYVNGALVPAEPLDLAEGQEVEITLRPLHRGR